MSKSLAFEFSALCGISYDCGDVRFTSDSKALLSPVGHRLTRFGLTGGGADSAADTFAFETLAPLRRVATSKTLLAVVDAEGRGLLCNTENGAVLHRFNVAGGTCRCLEFSPDGLYLAASVGRKVQVWRCPTSLTKTYSPMVLQHQFATHSSDVFSLSWVPSGNGFLTGSSDCTAHLQYFRRGEEEDQVEVHPANPWETSVSLVGHKTTVLGAYFFKRLGEAPCVFTVSEDGSLFEWRFGVKPDNEGRQRARRKKAKQEPIEHISKEEWYLATRNYVQPGSNALVTCVACNNESLMLFGFSDGVFSLYEVPSCQKLQSLAASKFALESAAITSDGSWLALASPTMGQLLVWEWLSETFVLKQQGHYYNQNTVAYSPDGRLMATGGDDGKVKVWSTATNTCFVTFSEHEGSITALTFATNTALISSSLDGTCRAFDMVRLRNFRTMSPPTACQLSSVAASDGEVVCAGGLEPPNIFMWSLRTGKLLDTLTGHTGPVSSLDFCSSRPLLASASWDGTIRLWEPYSQTTPTETLVNASSESTVPVNQLCVAFRPDGRALCSAGLDGHLLLWSVDDASLKGSIDCRRDLGVTEKVTSFLTSLCYSADGRIVLAGGKSSWVFAYDVERELLMKKFQLAHRVRTLGDGAEDDEGDDARKRRWREGKHLPGATRGRDAGKRATMDPTVEVSSVRFAPTGRSWSATTTQGLMVFSLDPNSSFEPMDIDVNCTPQSARQAALHGDFAKAINQALFLGEPDLISEMIGCVPKEAVSLVAKAIPKPHVPKCFEAVARRLEETATVEFNITWALALFQGISEADAERFRARLLPSLRSLQRVILRQDKLVSKACDENMYDLDFILHDLK